MSYLTTTAQRFAVTGYTDGEYCVVDSINDKMVKYHPSVGWETTFRIKETAEDLARLLNQEQPNTRDVT